MNGDLTFLSLSRGNKIPPSRDNAERLRLMRARLVPVVGNGYFNFPRRTGINYGPDIPDKCVPIKEFARRWFARHS